MFVASSCGSWANTLQATITAVYQEEWKQEGARLMEQSRLALWQVQEANDADQIAAALELEKQARVLLYGQSHEFGEAIKESASA